MARRNGTTLMQIGSDGNGGHGTKGAARENARRNKPILWLETMPPDGAFVDPNHMTKGFRRDQPQAHSWRQRNDLNVREYIYFDENDNRLPDLSRGISYRRCLPHAQSTNYAIWTERRSHVH